MDIVVFDTIIEEFHTAVYRLAYKFTGNKKDAEDVTQDTFMRAYENLIKYPKEDLKVKPWLMTICVNLCRNLAKKKKSFNFSALKKEDYDRDFQDSIKDTTLAKYMKQIDKDVKVPKSLAAKISHSVSKHAAFLEKRRIIKSFLKLGLAFGFVIYGLTATIINIVGSGFLTYIGSITEDPSILFSSDGFLAFWEMLPIVSLMLLVAATFYAVRHVMIKGVQNLPHLYVSVMTGMFIFVIGGSFIGGMSVGTDTIDSFFGPLIEDTYVYSTQGEVAEVKSDNEGGYAVTLLMSNGERREIEIAKEVFEHKKIKEIKKGDQLFVLSDPHFNEGSHDERAVFDDSQSVQLESADTTIRPVRANYIKFIQQN